MFGADKEQDEFRRADLQETGSKRGTTGLAGSVLAGRSCRNRQLHRECGESRRKTPPLQARRKLTDSSNLIAWSICLGNPSIKNLLAGIVACSVASLPSPASELMAARMAFSSNLIVTSIGTILPSLMCSLIMAPNSDPSRFCSARRRSPAGEVDRRRRVVSAVRGWEAPSVPHPSVKSRLTREVHETVLLDELRALGSFACVSRARGMAPSEISSSVK